MLRAVRRRSRAVVWISPVPLPVLTARPLAYRVTSLWTGATRRLATSSSTAAAAEAGPASHGLLGAAAGTTVKGSGKAMLRGGVRGLFGVVVTVVASNPLLRWGLPIGAGIYTLSLVLRATEKMQHKFTNLFRAGLEYGIYFAMLSLCAVGYLYIGVRRRLSMRAVHQQGFQRIRNMPEIHSRLGVPLHITEKRIEIRTGGYSKLQYAGPGKRGSDVGWISHSLGRMGLPVGYKYKLQRAHMVFPVMGRHQKKAMVCVEAVKRPWGSWSPFGHYEFKLVGVDFADNTYMIVGGDEERCACDSS
jgi:hypothetical protein